MANPPGPMAQIEAELDEYTKVVYSHALGGKSPAELDAASDALLALIRRALSPQPRQGEPKPICKTCNGRGMIYKSESWGEVGGVPRGSASISQCPDCPAPLLYNTTPPTPAPRFSRWPTHQECALHGCQYSAGQMTLPTPTPDEFTAFVNEIYSDRLVMEKKWDGLFANIAKLISVIDDNAAITRMSKDYPKLAAFYSKHAVGPLEAPSCLQCGKSMQGQTPAIQHLELPGIVICSECKK